MKIVCRVAAVLLCSISALAIQAQPDRSAIVSLSSTTLDVREVGLKIQDSLSAVAGEAGSEELLLVKFPGPVSEQQIRELEQRVERIYTYLPYDTFLVKMKVNEQHRASEPALGASWTGPYHPAYKMAPAVAEAGASTDKATGQRIVMLQLFPDVDLKTAVERLERRWPGKVVGTGAGRRFSRVRLLMTNDEIQATRDSLARMAEIFWIGIEPRRTLLNDTTVWVAQSGTSGGQQTPVYDQGIYGEGQIVGVLDTGIDADMCYFRDGTLGLPPQNPCNGGTLVDLNQRKVIGVDFLWNNECSGGIGNNEWDTQDHGSHVAGTIAGDDLANPLTHDPGDGVAPGAKLVVQDCGFQTDNCADCPGIGSCPIVDLNPVFQQAYDQGARIHNNSWGDDENNPVKGLYSAGSEDADEFMWNNKDFLLVFANGNDGPGTGSVGSPATAKNVLGVGATLRGSSADSMASFSSCGPTDDGRIKPDVTMPGSGIISANSDNNVSSNNCNTRSTSGTSMASPGAAGAAALIRQYYTDGWYPSGAANAGDALTPSAALLKATLINSATDMTNVAAIPSNCQGWGRVLLDDALHFSGDGRDLFVADDMTGFPQGSSGATSTFNLNVGSSSEPFKVTLTWTDFPSTPAASANLINDLDLEVTGPGGTYRGNVFSGGQSTTGGSADRINSVEQVLISVPTAGAYTVTVRSFTVPNGPQPFAVVATGDFAAACSVNADCDDGLFCNGTETCDAGSCVAGTPPCSGSQQCDEDADQCVDVVCLHDVDFESGAGGWTQGADTCTTGAFIVGTPDATDWQVGNGNPGQAFFTQNNAGGIGTDDVDGGTCEALSPVINATGQSEVTVSLDYYHGQRDAGDDAGDGFTIEVLDGGSVVATLASIGDVTNGASWTGASTTINNPGSLQLRVRATDAAAGGDIVEAGIDNVQVCYAVTSDCQSDADCNDGLFCNGAETCDVGSGQCQAGTAPDCSDGVSCTVDSCNETTDSCDHNPDDSACDNGQFCDGAEVCNVSSGCQAGSDPCAGGACDEAADICLECTVDADCDDGAFCNGAETCNSGICQAGVDPCPGQSCDEAGDVCTGGGACAHNANFESGAGGWTQGADTCTTGAFIVGTPDATTWQVGSGNPGQAFFTANNPSGIGGDDVDGGTCEALSPVVDCSGQAAAEVTLDYFHGQRDAADDAGDGFTIEILNNGSVVNTLVQIGDVTNNPAWSNVSAMVNNPGNIQVRVRATDATAGGDIVEGGIDNVQIAPATPPSCTYDEGFESGLAGWSNGASTCTTGAYVQGNPANTGGGQQIVGSHTGSGSLFTGVNVAAGNADVDGGNCVLDSPALASPAAAASTLTVWYWHGQRDNADDPNGGAPNGDFFLLEVSTNGGSSWTTIASNGDAPQTAAWTEATAAIPAGSDVRVRLQCSDGSAAGDLVECGLDDVSICN